MQVLESLIEEDEEVVSTWYLLGWLNYLRYVCWSTNSNTDISIIFFFKSYKIQFFFGGGLSCRYVHEIYLTVKILLCNYLKYGHVHIEI